MALVELRFSPLPAHVRTARLVAAAVARRAGLDDAVLDEVRLAVGEACSRAVELHRRHCPSDPVTVTLDDGGSAFAVAVADRVSQDPKAAEHPLETITNEADLDTEALPAGVGLAVITGLVDDLEVEPVNGGAVVRMTWPVPPAA
ncbi:MAG: ATP-binding protein [Actinomycetota bacterium]|nr:ATP-binding protein [Actinomycetota bacterium]